MTVCVRDREREYLLVFLIRFWCRSRYIQPLTQVLIALRFYASGSFQIAIADFAGVSVSSVCRVVKRVSLAIAKKKHAHIKMPATQEEMLECSRAFYAKAKFPRTIGAIDCTHIRIQSPGGEQAETFRNRKGWFSLNVQTVADVNLKVCNLETRWPGSTHDQTIFNASNICAQLEAGHFKAFILVGDSGYKNTRYLATPFVDPATSLEMLYNESQIRTRVVVERSYGVWKRRFPCLAMGLRVHLDITRDIITACAILHNMAIDRKDALPEVLIDGFADMLAATQIPAATVRIAASRVGRSDANTVRAFLMREYFTALNASNAIDTLENA